MTARWDTRAKALRRHFSLWSAGTTLETVAEWPNPNPNPELFISLLNLLSRHRDGKRGRLSDQLRDAQVRGVRRECRVVQAANRVPLRTHGRRPARSLRPDQPTPPGTPSRFSSETMLGIPTLSRFHRTRRLCRSSGHSSVRTLPSPPENCYSCTRAVTSKTTTLFVHTELRRKARFALHSVSEEAVTRRTTLQIRTIHLPWKSLKDLGDRVSSRIVHPGAFMRS